MAASASKIDLARTALTKLVERLASAPVDIEKRAVAHSPADRADHSLSIEQYRNRRAAQAWHRVGGLEATIDQARKDIERILADLGGAGRS